jgi:glycosyltransferase involved in cell wall biosynthesis
VLGPLGGSLDPPASFTGDVGSAPWYTRLRALDAARFRFDPWLRRSYREAAVLIGVAPYVRELLRGIDIQRFETLSETGVASLPPPRAPRDASEGRGMRLLFVGRLVRTKGIRDLIRAIGQLRDLEDLRLDVLGTGEEREVCERLANELGIADRVVFHGQVPRERVDDFYREASLFAFPSFCEPSGNVVFEALSAGLPVLTADAGGPGFVVNDRCGIKVPVTTPTQFAEALAKAIRSLAEAPERLDELGEGARSRVEELALWENKVAWVSELYRTVVKEHSAAPE